MEDEVKYEIAELFNKARNTINEHIKKYTLTMN